MVAARRTKVVEHGGVALWILVLLTGIYGGYFGAAQGVILLSLLGIFIADDLQRLNGVKNVLAAIANGVAALVFVFAADVAWDVAALIAVGSIVGAQFGATFRAADAGAAAPGVIVVVGLVAAIKLLVDLLMGTTATAAATTSRERRRAARSSRRSARRASRPSWSRSVGRTIACSNRSVVSCTVPSGSITALMPDTDAWSTGRAGLGRPHLAVREVLLELPDRWYERLLVLTTIDLGALAHGVAHERAERRLEADHAPDLVPAGAGTRRSRHPARSRTGSGAARADEAERVAPRHVLAERHEVLLRVRALQLARRACT